MSRRAVVYTIAVALVATYGWFATNVKPFHAISYVVVALPILIVVGLYVFVGAFDEGPGVSHYLRERSLGVSLARSTPWLLVLVGAISLEIVALVLGGQSSRVPTLSTMVDHLLSTHGLRCVLFLLWLVVGLAPLRRLSERRRRAVLP
jgi:hypothetical protein